MPLIKPSSRKGCRGIAQRPKSCAGRLRLRSSGLLGPALAAVGKHLAAVLADLVGQLAR